MKTRNNIYLHIIKYTYLIIAFFLLFIGITVFNSKNIKYYDITAYMLIVFGVIKICAYFSHDLYRLAFQFDLREGIYIIVMNIIYLYFNKSITMFIFMIASISIVNCVSRFKTVFDARDFGIKNWNFALYICVMKLCMALAFIYLALSYKTFDPVQFIGWIIILEAIENIYVVSTMVKIVKNQYVENIDSYFNDEESEEIEIRKFDSKE